MFGVSSGVFWAKIVGNQDKTIPNLPIYPRTLDVCKKKQKIARESFRNNLDIPNNFTSISF